MSDRHGRATAVLAALLLLLGVLPSLIGRLNSDVAWLVYVGERVVEGADLYGTVIETNPPLAVWLTLPAASIASVTPVDALRLFNGLVAVAAGAVLWCAWRLLGDSAGRGERALTFLAVVAIGMFVVPGLAFAQREHLAVVATFPYLLNVGLGGAGEARSTGSDVTRGVLAGLGFGLKPHFLLVVLAAEGWLWFRDRGDYRLLRPAPSALAATLVAYAAAVLVLEPDYLRVLGELVLPNYPYNSPRSLLGGLGSAGALVTYAGLSATLLTARLRAELDSLAAFFAVLAVVWLAVAVVQRQTFGYHYLPAVLCSMFALGASLTGPALAVPDVPAEDGPETGTGGRRSRLGTVVGAAVLALFVGVYASRGATQLVWTWSEEGEEYRRLRAVVGAAGGESPVVAGLNFSPWPAFPLVNDTEAVWAPRHPVLWLITSSRRRSLSSGVRSGEDRALAPMTPREARYRDQHVADLTTHGPDVLLVPRRRGGAGDFDVFRYFLRDPRFARWLGGYRPVDDALGHHVWIRDGSAEADRIGRGEGP